jgi:prevent-host-death family protein
MNNTVTVAEARDRLPELLRKVAAGEGVVLTDGGKPVAILTAPPYGFELIDEATAQARAGQAMRELIALGEEVSRNLPPDFNLQEILDEYRRGHE